MAEKAQATAVKPGTNSGPVPVIKRGPGHRAVDARDAIAELTERAQEISLEAGSRVAIAMKDVISAAAGIAGFAVESARDLVSFMVRRGQMTPEEGDKLLREAEASHSKRPASERKKPTASEITAKERAAQRAKAAAAREHAMMVQHVARTQATQATHAARVASAKKSSPKKASAKKARPARSSKRAARPKTKSAKKGSKRR
jgi:polyhydroxyalkanoate synthesis regulator phasin